MNNLLSFFGLVDARINASDKDLPVQMYQKSQILAKVSKTILTNMNMIQMKILMVKNH